MLPTKFFLPFSLCLLPFCVHAEQQNIDEDDARGKSGTITAESELLNQSNQLETITVTAQKQEEDLLDVPVSMSTLSSYEVADGKIESVKDMADFVSNLTLNNTGSSEGNVPSMRGIYADLESNNIATGLFIDGIPILESSAFEYSLLEIERIEVLRGPQGTLYGKGTEAGAINIYTRQPDNEYTGKVGVQVGEDNKRELQVNYSGPIKEDELFFSLAGKFYSKDGFIEHTIDGGTVDDRQNWFGRINLVWLASDDLQISLTNVNQQHDDSAYRMNLTAEFAPMFGLTAPEDRKVSSNLQGFEETQTGSTALKVIYDINDQLSLTSITTSWEHKKDFEMDYDFSAAPIYHADSLFNFNKKSQELRLNYSKDNLKWLLGLYFDDVKNETDYTVNSANPVSRVTAGKSHAIFTNLTYPLNENLNVITGLRYAKEEQVFKDNLTGSETDDSWQVVTPKVALEYRFNKETMTYVSVSKGFRSGGFNANYVDTDYTSFDKEELWSYELGTKSKFMNNTIQLNTSVFYMDISDMQVSEVITPAQRVITNAAEASGSGFEIELKALLTEGLTVTSGVGYTNIEFDEFSDLTGDYKGNNNPYSPDYTFFLGAQYRHQNGFYSRIDIVSNGKMYLDKANKYSRDAYELVNVKFGYEANDFGIYFYGRNIFDKEYDQVGVSGGTFTVYSEPRELGIQANYYF